MKEIVEFKTSEEKVGQSKAFERITKQAEDLKLKLSKMEEKNLKHEKQIFEV